MVKAKSRFLKKEDLDGPTIVTIRGFKQVEIENDNGGSDSEVVVFFEEMEKPMVINITNRDRLIDIFGDDSNAAKGKQITIWNDPDVSFGTKRTGGLRIDQ